MIVTTNKKRLETRPGIFLKLILETNINGFHPISFLSLLKHELSQGSGFKDYRSRVRDMDKFLMRGIRQTGFDAYKEFFIQKTNNNNERNKPPLILKEFLDHLENIFLPLTKFDSEALYEFDDILTAHLQLAEKLASGQANDGATLLWQGEAGNALSIFISELRQETPYIKQCTLSQYSALFEEFIGSQTVRPRYGVHPRIAILGQMEARLHYSDRVILAGLNENTWPPNVGHDPWMSRPMRDKFGLPKPERVITLAAHDFVSNICAPEVFLTRSKRQDGY